MIARLTTAGRIALAAGALALVVTVLSLRAPIGAILTPSPGAVADAQGRESNADRQLDRAAAQINGRSLFFTPAEPPPPPPPRVAEAEDEPDPTPPPPARYAGPSLTAMINGVAWFSDGTKLGPSDEPEGDLRVVRLVPPWEAVIEWKGVEFTVSLFARDQVVLPQEPAEDPSETDTVAMSPDVAPPNDIEDPQ